MNGSAPVTVSYPIGDLKSKILSTTIDLLTVMSVGLKVTETKRSVNGY